MCRTQSAAIRVFVSLGQRTLRVCAFPPLTRSRCWAAVSWGGRLFSVRASLRFARQNPPHSPNGPNRKRFKPIPIQNMPHSLKSKAVFLLNKYRLLEIVETQKSKNEKNSLLSSQTDWTIGRFCHLRYLSRDIRFCLAHTVNAN